MADKKPRKPRAPKAPPEIQFRNLYVRVTPTYLEFVIPIGIVYTLDVNGKEIPQVLYQQPIKKYIPLIDRYQALPRGKKYVINKEYFQSQYRGIEPQDVFHKKFWEAENARGGGASYLQL